MSDWHLDPPDDPPPSAYDELCDMSVGELIDLADQHRVYELGDRIDSIVADHWDQIEYLVIKLADQIERQRLRDEGEDRAEARKAALEDYA